MGRAFSSLRARLSVLVLLTILPLLSLIVCNTERELHRNIAQARVEALRFAEFIAGDVEQMIGGVRQMLLTLAGFWCGVVAPGDAGACGAVLSSLQRKCPAYADLGLAAPDGSILCAAAPDGAVTNVSERAWFRRAVQHGELAAGEFLADHKGGRDILTFAYPCYASVTGGLAAVAFATLDFAWLHDQLSNERVSGRMSLFPRGASLNVVDGAGMILYRYPDPDLWVGKVLTDESIVRSMLGARGGGMAEGAGMDGAVRIYAVVPVSGPPPADLFVAVGLSKRAIVADSRGRLARSVAWLCAITALGLAVAWAGGHLFLARPLARLLEATRQLAAGALGTRSRVSRGPAELIQLGDAFDAMASAIEQRDSALKDGERRLRAMLDQILAHQGELRGLTLRLTLVGEEERKRLAAQLHDSVVQTLSLARIKLGALLEAPTGAERRGELEEMRDVLGAALTQLRSLTFELSPPILYEFGLVAAIEWLGEQFEQRHGIGFRFERPGQPTPVEEPVRILVFQSVRELLANVAKHARATQVVVRLTAGGDTITISVRDDGAGFEPARAWLGSGRMASMGLFTVRERMRHIGGDLRIDSAPGRGTVATLTAPRHLPAAGGARGNHGNEGDAGG